MDGWKPINNGIKHLSGAGFRNHPLYIIFQTMIDTKGEEAEEWNNIIPATYANVFSFIKVQFPIQSPSPVLGGYRSIQSIDIKKSYPNFTLSSILIRIINRKFCVSRPPGNPTWSASTSPANSCENHAAPMDLLLPGTAKCCRVQTRHPA